MFADPGPGGPNIQLLSTKDLAGIADAAEASCGGDQGFRNKVTLAELSLNK